MKAPILLLALISLPCFSTIDSTRYTEQAKAWVSQHIVSNGKLTVPASDAQLILNLMYFSYARSEITVRAQEVAVQTLKATWQGWQNIAQTRLNPSHPIPYPRSLDNDQALFEQFLILQEQHHRIGQCYSKTVNTIIDGNILTSAQAMFAIDRLRIYARGVVLESLMSIKQQLSLFRQCSQELSDIMSNRSPSRSMFENGLLSFLPGFALNSFLKMESCYQSTSTITWNALAQLQQLSVIVYRAIEEERASFYAAHYQELYCTMKGLGLKASYFTVAFNESGLLTSGQRTEKLPSLLP